MTAKKYTPTPEPSVRQFSAVGVRLADVAAHTGRTIDDIEAEAAELHMTVSSDWADHPTLAPHDARSIVTGEGRRIAEHDATWAAYLADCRSWQQNRTRSVTSAQEEVLAAAQARGEGRGSASGRALEAAFAAGQSYEATVPRPAWNGDTSNAPLAYTTEDQPGLLMRARRALGVG